MRICRIAGMERERERERERESKREIERCRPKMHTHRPGTKACCSHCMRSKSCAKVFPAKQTNKCYGCGAAWDQEKKKKESKWTQQDKKKIKKEKKYGKDKFEMFSTPAHCSRFVSPSHPACTSYICLHNEAEAIEWDLIGKVYQDWELRKLTISGHHQ